MRNFLKKIIILLLFMPACVLLAQQEPPLLPEEAPATLFSSSINDSEVELFASGSWNSNAGFGIGYLIDEDGRWLYGYMPDEMNNGFFYEQDAGLFLSLLFMERFFLDISLTDNMEDNTYVTGYLGKEGEIIQNISIGNDRIGFKDSYRYTDVSAQSVSDLGIYGLFESSISRHELIVRLDSTALSHVRYFGTSLAEEKYLELYSYERGRFFVLPDNNPDFLTVYIEDSEGSINAPDGSSFRKARADEYVYSLSQGTFYLTKPANTRIAVFYKKGGKPVGDSSLGRAALCGVSNNMPDPLASPVDFDWSSSYLGYSATDWQIQLEGENCLLVYIPGSWTPFEDMSRYVGNGEVRLVEKGSSTSSSLSQNYIIKTDGDIITIYNKDFLQSPQAARYPFSDIYPALYGPYASYNPDYTSHRLLILSFGNAGRITAPQDAIPESIRVYVNDREERNISVDKTTLEIKFPYPVNSYDRIDIYYKTKESQAYSELLVATGNTWYPTDNSSIKLASMLSYPVSDIKYAKTENDAKSDIIGSLEASYKGEAVSLRGDMGIRYSINNLTGYLRAFSSDKTRTKAAYSASIYPASPPYDVSDSLDPDGQPTGIGISGLTRYNRAILYYKDYYQYTSYGRGSLADYTWTPPSEQSPPYTDGNKPGPYIASASSDGKSDAIMVMDFFMQNTETWAGAQLNMPSGTGEISAISLEYKVAELTTGGTESINIFLQAGYPAEDLDDDGILDKETSPYSGGFDFYDAAHNVHMIIGTDPSNQPDMIQQSEDIDKNNIADKENPDATTTFLLAQGINTTGSWNSINIKIPDNLRAKISNAKSLRIIITRSTTGISTTGKILFTPPVISHSSFYTTSNDSNAQINSYTATDTSLAAQSDFVKQTFLDGNSSQNTSIISWQALDTDGFTAISGIEEIPTEYYNKISLYIKSDTSITYDITLVSNDTEVIKAASLSIPGDSTWHLVELDYKNNRVYLDKIQDSSAYLTYKPTDSPVNKLKLSIATPPAASGTIYIDELYASEPQNSASFMSTADISLNSLKALITYGSIDIIGASTLDQSISIYHDISPIQKTGITSSSRLSSTILTAPTDILFDISTYDNSITKLAAGHSIKIPIGISTTTESFYHTIKSAQKTTHNAQIEFATDTVNAGIYHSIKNLDEEQTKEYSLGFNITKPDFTLETKTALSQTKAATDTLGLDYITAYTESWRQIVPKTSSNDITRDTQFAITPSLITENTKTTLKAGIQHTSLPQLAEHNTKENIKLSSEINISPLTLSPYYMRNTGTTKQNTSSSFLQDWQQLADSLSDIPLIISTIPFYELWQDPGTIYKSIPADYTKANHTAETGINISRNPSPGITELIVPISAGLSAGTNYTKTYDTTITTRTASLNLAFLATNLFGSMSAAPLTNAYSLDEFSRSLKITRSRQVESALTTWKIDWTETASLFTDLPRGLNINNTLSLNLSLINTWSNTSQLALTWASPAPSWAKDPPLEVWKNTQAELEHTESLTVELTGSSQSSTDYTITASHTSGLVYGRTGRFNLYFNNTIQKKDNIILIGWVLGANLILQF